MKKLMSVILAVLVAMTISATKKKPKGTAVSKGNLWMTGAVNLSSFSGDLGISCLMLGSSGVYFVIDHLGVGGVLSFINLDDKDDFYDLNYLNLAGKVIYAFDNFAKSKFYPYAGASLGFGSIGDGDSESGFVFWMGGGMNYLLGKHIGILAELGYYSASLGDIDYSGLILQAGLTGVFKP